MISLAKPNDNIFTLHSKDAVVLEKSNYSITSAHTRRGAQVCHILSPLPELLEAAKLVGCPVLRSDKATTTFITTFIHFLNKLLAPTMTMHGAICTARALFRKKRK